MKAVISFGVFAASKLLVFGVLLLYPIAGFAQEYVTLETQLAKALMFTPLLILGLTTSFSHYKINVEDVSIDRLYWGYILALSVFLVMLIVGVNFVEPTALASIAILTLIVASRFISQAYKTKSDVLIAALCDACPYLIFLFILVGLIFQVPLNTAVGWGFLWVFAPLLIIVLVFYLGSPAHLVFSAHTLDFFKFGLRASLVSIVSSVYMAAPRAYPDLFIPYAEQEIFYLSLRYSLAIVFLYQFFYVRYFEIIYRLESKSAIASSLFIFLFSYAFSFFSLSLLVLFGILRSDEYVHFSCLLVSVWTASSFLEYFISRFFLVSKFLWLVLTGSCAIFFFCMLMDFAPITSVIILLSSLVVFQVLALFFSSQPIGIS